MGPKKDDDNKVKPSFKHKKELVKILEIKKKRVVGVTMKPKKDDDGINK